MTLGRNVNNVAAELARLSLEIEKVSQQSHNCCRTTLQLLQQQQKVLQAILDNISQLMITQGIDDSKLDTIETQIQQILKEVTIPPAVGFKVTVTSNDQPMLVQHILSDHTIVTGIDSKENSMPKKVGASADVTVNDNGTATLHVTFEDADGVAVPAPSGFDPTTIAIVASDATPGPATFSQGTAVATPNGFDFPLTVVQPPPQPLHTGVTFAVTIPSGLQGQTAPITETSDPPLDVVPGPASTFVASASNP